MPYVHVLPASVEVAHPTSALPQPIDPGTRATWNVPTMIFPQEAKSGSTSVLCTLSELWSVSVLIFTRVNCACAGATRTPEIANASTTVRRANGFRFIRFSLCEISISPKFRLGACYLTRQPARHQVLLPI